MISFDVGRPAISLQVFTSIGTQGAPGASADEGAGAVWAVTVNRALLGTLPEQVSLNLPGHSAATLTRLRAELRGAQGFLWTGRGDGCSALFSGMDDRVRAVISCLDAPWGVETTPSGAELTRYDAFAEPDDDLPNDIVAPVDEVLPLVASVGAPYTTDTSVDVLVLYTANVRAALGNANVRQVMRDTVDATQLAMDNSTSPGEPTIAQLNFVHAQEVARPENEDFNQDLTYLRTDAEPVALRNFWAADVVMFVRETSPQTTQCGLAYGPGIGTAPAPGPGFAPYAVAVTKRSCSFSPYSFQHEFAHLFGANHNPESNSNPTPLEPWAFAHWANHGAEDSARTIVAYQFDACHGICPQVLNYSNADITLTDPWAFHTGLVDQRENARVIAEFAPPTAMYRSSLGRIFADSFE